MKFTISWLPYDKDRLPSAGTCFHLLKLPAYPSYEVLEAKLLVAVRYGSEGFAFT
jgi:hypothetical protein